MPVDITPENHEKVVKNNIKPVVIDVYASWCGPCSMFAPIFAEVAEALGESYEFAKLSAEEYADIAAEYAVTALPTVLFIKDGSVIAREQGYMDKAQLQEYIKNHLG